MFRSILLVLFLIACCNPSTTAKATEPPEPLPYRIEWRANRVSYGIHVTKFVDLKNGVTCYIAGNSGAIGLQCFTKEEIQK